MLSNFLNKWSSCFHLQTAGCLPEDFRKRIQRMHDTQGIFLCNWMFCEVLVLTNPRQSSMLKFGRASNC